MEEFIDFLTTRWGALLSVAVLVMVILLTHTWFEKHDAEYNRDCYVTATGEVRCY